MGHKLVGAQHTYTKPTLLEVYAAIKPAFEDLTINSNTRKSIALELERKRLELLESDMADRVFQKL